MKKHIGVLLGDPRYPYPYAPDGKFGPDEIEADHQLRGALAKLDGYRFSYLDDHDRLIDTLRSEPPDLVLNLRDTGFREALFR
jgi:D-alanine-D-alanine ligase